MLGLILMLLGLLIFYNKNKILDYQENIAVRNNQAFRREAERGFNNCLLDLLAAWRYYYGDIKLLNIFTIDDRRELFQGKVIIRFFYLSKL